MLLVRDVFRCKPGHAGDVARRLKVMAESITKEDGFENCRVLVDFIGDYWTVVVQAEVADLAAFERHMAEYPKRKELQDVMSGYTELVDSGYREIFRIV